MRGYVLVIIELDVIKIQDLNTGTKRVADDIKNVLRKIESWHRAHHWLPHHVPRIEWALDWRRLGRYERGLFRLRGDRRERRN